jgi:hypothetical protein
LHVCTLKEIGIRCMVRIVPLRCMSVAYYKRTHAHTHTHTRAHT